MFLKMLRAKIHKATITGTDLEYVGSITLDEDLLRATSIRPNEVVLVADMDNGQRFETYVLKGQAGSGIVAVNGAAARLVRTGDRIIIFAHSFVPVDQADEHEATVVLVDERNHISRRMIYPSSMTEPVVI